MFMWLCKSSSDVITNNNSIINLSKITKNIPFIISQCSVNLLIILWTQLLVTITIKYIKCILLYVIQGKRLWQKIYSLVKEIYNVMQGRNRPGDNLITDGQRVKISVWIAYLSLNLPPPPREKKIKLPPWGFAMTANYPTTDLEY